MKIGPYDILEELGRGGMGVVYKARHAPLGHEVALKVVAPDALSGLDVAEAFARFQREVQAAAGLADHPGIVGVRDAGRDGTTGWFAMDLVAGGSLEDRIHQGETDWREAVAVIAQAARAVHYAHGKGVLHRDLKPGNILLEFPRQARELANARAEAASVHDPAAAGHAGPRARVTDFGLARLAPAGPELSRLTRSGVVLGTPAYMPPEQAEGRVLDARADVYALGATLHEAVAGSPPFGGASAFDVVQAVLRQPPPPLRQIAPGAPRDVETIVLTCLEKRAVHRYPTAAALADDCERALRGEPIRARRPGALTRVGRAAARRPGVLAATALTLASVAASVAVVARPRAGGTAAEAVAAAADATARAERTRRHSATFQSLVRETLPAMSRLADHAHGAAVPADEVARALATVGTAATRASAAAPEARGPQAWVGLARCWGGDVESGLATLRAAVAEAGADPFPRVCLAQALLTGYILDTPLPDLRYEEGVVEVPPFAETPEARAHRERAADVLAPVRDAAAWAGIAEAEAWIGYARGAGALAAGELPVAIEALSLLADDPLLGPEADYLCGLALFQAARYPEAADAWTRVAARGWWRGGMGAGNAWAAATTLAAARGTDPRPGFSRAIAAYTAAIAIAPDVIGARHARGLATLARADAAASRGADASADYAAARADQEAAMREAPARVELGVSLASALSAEAEWAARAGRDVVPGLRAAMAAVDRVVEALPALTLARVVRASIAARLGEAFVAGGADADPVWAVAMGDFDRALAADPSDVGTRHNRGNLWRQVALRDRAAGRDPRPALDRSRADLDAALAARPGHAQALVNRGLTRTLCGDTEAAAERDPRPELRGALADFDAALAALPRDPTALRGRGSAWRALAMAEDAAGGDPFPLFARGIADLDLALAVDPGDATLHNNRGTLRSAIAMAREARGEDARPDYEQAADDFRASIARNPRDPQPHVNLGVSCELLGRRDEAITAFRSAVALNPSLAHIVEWLKANAPPDPASGGR